MLAMSLEQVKNAYNAIEPFIWYAVGLLCIPALRRLVSLRRRLLLAGLLIAFGTSDFFEGEAWWTPWWLLAWKVGCLAAILAQVEHF